MVYFPFTAIVGQDEMKMALILNVINPLLGGILICGQKGTAKSTAVRSLASVMPEIEVVEGCRFHCDPQDIGALCDDCRKRAEKGEQLPITRQKTPVVDLPLGATEDRVIGTLDIEQAIKKGERRFQPGVLADANRGILYVDEVNLLDDHLVDILLDVSASGVNIVEREGISFSHPARLILVGTMNPEEGELRPQLLDRFGLFVQVQGLDDPVQRATVIRRNLEYEDNPAAFVKSWKQKEMESRDSILKARKVLSKVVCPDKMYDLAARMAIDFGVHGHRTDLLLIKTAKTIAAFRGHTQVSVEDFQKAASLILPHRMKKRFSVLDKHEGANLQELVREWSEDNLPTSARKTEYEEISSHSQLHEPKEAPEKNVPVGRPFAVRHLSVAPNRSTQPRTGKRSKTEAYSGSGKRIGSIMPRSPSIDIAFDATLRAAALYQVHRDRGNLAIAIEYPDLRQKRKSKRVAHTILFLVDASGSMDARHRMVQTKAAILSLLNDAYKKRDRVGMVTFNHAKARVVLPPTSDKEKAKSMLQRLPVGGRTPLSMGLSVAHEVIKKYALKMKNEILLLVVISDGKANVTMNSLGAIKEAREEVLTHYGLIGKYRLPSFCEFVYSRALQEAIEVAAEIRRSGVKSIVVDTAISGRKGQMEKLCGSLGGQYFRADELRAERLVDVVNSSLHRSNVLILHPRK